MNTRTVLHIGGAKTASTTLQATLLSNAQSIYHFGEDGDGVTTPAEQDVIRALLNEDESLFDFTEVESLFKKHRELAGERTLVFSSADVLLANRPTLAARRLHALLGSNVDVLLVVRNQFDALSSFYAGHGAWLKPAPAPYYRRFVSFSDWLDFQFLHPSSSALASFAYWEQLQPFMVEFGREHSVVVPFEELVKGNADVWSKLEEFFDLKTEEAWLTFSGKRKRRERISLWQKRYGELASYMRPFLPAPDVRLNDSLFMRTLQRGPRFVPEWPTGMKERIQAFYVNGNAALEKEFSLGLSQLGYPIEVQ